MEPFDSLRAEHIHLLEIQQTEEDSGKWIPQVKSYIEKTCASGSKIKLSSEREQLQAILRFWIGTILENETNQENKIYPNVDLYPYTGNPGKMNRNFWILIAVLFGLILVLYIFSNALQKTLSSQMPSTTKTMDVSSIELATLKAAATTTSIHIQTQGIDEIQVQATPQQNTSVLNLLDEILETQTETLANEVPMIKIEYPVDGQEISPDIDITGTYVNMTPGWSLHLLIKPLTRNEFYYPLEALFIVPDNQTTGTWNIRGDLSEIFDIGQEESYQILPIAVSTENLRDELTQKEHTVIKEIPQDAMYFENSIIEVNLPAYRSVRETRVIFSSYVEQDGTYDVFCILSDGSDLQRITNTPTLSELYPNLSPDGKQIVFVGTESIDGKINMAIMVMDSSGTNERQILAEENTAYEHPVWSPDGKSIAYSYRKTNLSEDQGWKKSVMDINGNFSILMTQEDNPAFTVGGSISSERYLTWLDATTIAFSLIDAGQAEIHLWNVKSLDIRPFYSSDLVILEPSVSPDGKFLTYVGYRTENPNRDIYVTSLDTGETTRLTTAEELDSSPQWLPDNQTIIYESWKTDRTTLWAVNRDTTNNQQLTFAPFGNDTQPSVGMIDTWFRISSGE